MADFDFVVIGTGAAGATAAHIFRQAGKSVAIIDSHPFGGTCALRGCDPKKVLVGAAEVEDAVRRYVGLKIGHGRLALDWPALMAFKRTFTDDVPARRKDSYAKAGIETFDGRAHFLGSHSLEVGGRTLSAGHFVIAAGAAPVPLGIAGKEHVLRSDEFLELSALPRRIAFIGGGYISMEFAHVAARCGSRVTVIHRGSRPLEAFDPDLVAMLVKSSGEAGITFLFNAAVQGVERTARGFRVVAHTPAGEQRVDADLVVHGAGRAADIADMGLERAGVQTTGKGVRVNEFLQTTEPHIYAAGDAADSGGPPLTPVASVEGSAAATNLLRGNSVEPDYAGVPSVAFTIPPIALAGLSEEQARLKGGVRVIFEDTSSWYSSRRIGVRHSGFKVIVEEASGKVLGAHLFGPHSDEVINVFALAIREGIPAQALKTLIWAYPTHASDIAYMV